MAAMKTIEDLLTPAYEDYQERQRMIAERFSGPSSPYATYLATMGYIPNAPAGSMGSYFPEFSMTPEQYAGYQAAQVPPEEPTGMMGGMNLVSLENLIEADSWGARQRALSSLKEAGYTQKQIDALGMLGSAGVPLNQLKPDYVQDVYRQAGIDPNKMITMDGKTYLIG